MNQTEAYRLLHDGVIALARAERNGIRVDLDYVNSKFDELTDQIDGLESDFMRTRFYKHWTHSRAGREPNIYSNIQLANFLYKVKKIEPPKITPSGQGSVDEETLSSLGIPELDDLIQISKLKKVRDVYLNAFRREQVDGWLHPSFNLHLVRTFRSSSDRPNFQNIPKRDKESMRLTRKALYPRPGHQFLEVDYGALEVRVAACYHKDPTMIKYLKEGYDMHADMTKQIFKIDDFDKHRPDHAYLRAATKNGFVFPQFYGDYFGNNASDMACKWGELPRSKWKEGQGVTLGNGHLSDHMLNKGFKDLNAFTEHLKQIEEDFWENRFPKYARWKEHWWKGYQKRGYIDMLTGFRCSGVMGRNDAINYPVQGAAFHCLLWSLIRLDRVLSGMNFRSRIVGQIHDAIVFDIYPPELEKLVQTIKEITTKDLPMAWKWIIVPLEVEFEVCDIDASWADKKELKI